MLPATKNVELDIVTMQKNYLLLLISSCANETKRQDLYINDRSPTCAESASRTSMINNADHDDCLHRNCSQNDFSLAFATEKKGREGGAAIGEGMVG